MRHDPDGTLCLASLEVTLSISIEACTRGANVFSIRTMKATAPSGHVSVSSERLVWMRFESHTGAITLAISVSDLGP